MTMPKNLLSVLLLGVIFIGFTPPNALAKSKPKLCAATAIIPLAKYVRTNEAKCITSNAGVLSLSLSAFNSKSSTLATASSSRIKQLRRVKGDHSNQCKYVGIPAAGMFFSTKDVRCFTSNKRAERRGFRHLIVPTTTTTTGPTTTTIPVTTTTVTTTTTTTTIDPSRQAISYHVTLQSNVPEGNGYSGTCDATLQQGHNVLSVHCVHTVPSATEFHIHIVPSNDGFCEVPTPGSDFNVNCSLTTADRDGILSGNGLVAIHFGSPGTSSGLDGYLR